MTIRLLSFNLLIALLVAGCSWTDTLRQFGAIETRALLKGQVEGLTSDSTTYVVVSSADADKPQLVQRQAVEGEGHYQFHLLPGRYHLGAFTDLNNDAIYQADEPAAYIRAKSGAPRELIVEGGSETSLELLDASKPLSASERPDINVDISSIDPNLGQITSLNDPRFSPKNARSGFSRPLSHIKNTTGGLMFLDEYDPDKTPVLFVHGIKGTTRSFESIIDSLDRSQFQVWVYQYPSGLPLKVTSDYLSKALHELHNQHGFNELMIVAHSMGGLITRQFILEHANSADTYSIPAAITINSPLLGLKSAASGVRYSPVVAPVWRDIAAGSAFIEGLHSRDWPPGTEYTLVASFLRGQSNDGVIPFASQVSLALQKEATFFYVFEDEHTAILRNDDLMERIKMSLERATSDF